MCHGIARDESGKVASFISRNPAETCTRITIGSRLVFGIPEQKPVLAGPGNDVLAVVATNQDFARIITREGVFIRCRLLRDDGATYGPSYIQREVKLIASGNQQLADAVVRLMRDDLNQPATVSGVILPSRWQWFVLAIKALFSPAREVTVEWEWNGDSWEKNIRDGVTR